MDIIREMTRETKNQKRAILKQRWEWGNDERNKKLKEGNTEKERNSEIDVKFETDNKWKKIGHVDPEEINKL
jgi:hypothetical protein